jgi:hypothetical protein
MGLRAAERSLPAAPAAEGGLKLSFKRDGNTYWFLADAALRRFYLYVKGPSTRHKAKYLGRRSLTDVVNLAVSAGALHVVDALSRLVSRLEKALEKAAEEVRAKAEEAAERIAEAIRESEEWPLVRRHRGVLADFLLWLEEWSEGLVDSARPGRCVEPSRRAVVERRAGRQGDAGVVKKVKNFARRPTA